MIAVKTDEVRFDDSEVEMSTDVGELDELKIKVMFWDDIGKMTPITESLTVVPVRK